MDTIFPEWNKAYYFLVVQNFTNLLKLTFFLSQTIFQSPEIDFPFCGKRNTVCRKVFSRLNIHDIRLPEGWKKGCPVAMTGQPFVVSASSLNGGFYFTSTFFPLMI